MFDASMLIAGTKMQGLLNESLSVYSQLRDEVRKLLKELRALDKNYYSFSANQLNYFSERCQSVNVLLQVGKLWDADIIMRSALECVTRFIFVGIAPPGERERRIYEYVVGLNEIENIQRSEKAKNFVSVSTDEIEVMLVGGVVLSPEREAELRDRWPKSKRSIIKQKWSFSEMAREITGFQDGFLDLTGYKALLHRYGLSSHLIHADQTAIDLSWDRENREPQVKKALEQAHYARLATEQVSMLFMCWRVMAYAMGAESRNVEVVKSLRKLNERADVYHQAFAKTQEHLYK